MTATGKTNRTWIHSAACPESDTNPMHVDYAPGESPEIEFCRVNGISFETARLTTKILQPGQFLNNDGTPKAR